MRTVLNISRVIVGVLFIFSGLIKANDPLGLSYKMQEFFELWGMTSFNNITLFLSVVMIAFEIIAGAALLLGWRLKLFIWLLLLLTLFFTFLTGYAYLSGKFKNCGCFGDCIPITPLTSFLKDVFLTALILILFAGRKKIRPLFARGTGISMMLITIASFGIQWYTLTYLPVFDCLPYRSGNNIPALQKMPANARPDSTVITFQYKKQGKDIEFTADKFPDDFNDSLYEFKGRYDRVVRKGSNNEPPIKGFTLVGSTGADSTEVVLNDNLAVLIFCEDFSTPISDWQTELQELVAAAREKNVPVYVITARREEAVKNLGEAGYPDLQIFTADNTAIRTAARTNPCIYLLKKGTIAEKQGYRRSHMVIKALKSSAPAPAKKVPAPATQDSSSDAPALQQIKPDSLFNSTGHLAIHRAAPARLTGGTYCTESTGHQ